MPAPLPPQLQTTSAEAFQHHNQPLTDYLVRKQTTSDSPPSTSDQDQAPEPPTLVEIDEQIAWTLGEIRDLVDGAREAAQEFTRERARLNMSLVNLRSLRREITRA